MSKILITQMPYKDTILEVSALLENNRIVDLYVQRQGEKYPLGNIYVGKVEKAARDLKAVFVRISNDQICFLPLKDCLDPIYKMPGRQGEAKAGDELLVQVSREAQKEKLPSVSANLNFTGKYLVLTTGETRLGISSRITCVKAIFPLPKGNATVKRPVGTYKRRKDRHYCTYRSSKWNG